VEKICCAVEWINDPLVFGRFFLQAAFFGQNAMIRVGLVQYIDNRLFCLVVDFADKIIAALAGNGKSVEPIHVARDNISRRTCSAYRYGYLWIHVKFVKNVMGQARWPRILAYTLLIKYSEPMNTVSKNQQALLDRIRVIMVNTSHPGNIGAAARAMKNMGLSRLVLVDPVKLPGLEGYSRAVGADDVLGAARVVPTLADAVQGCCWVAGTSARLRTVQWPVYLPRECASELTQHAANDDVAIVFGRERTGLSNAELELCNALVHIPTNPDFSSLNVAAAIQVLCYETRLAVMGETTFAKPGSGKHRDDVPASSELLQGMYEHLFQTLQMLNFFGTSNPEIVMRRLKGLFNRAQTTRHEVAILRGILSAVQGKKSRK